MATQYVGGSPGYLFRRLILELKTESLLKLLDSQTLSLIDSIETSLTSSQEKLALICIKLIEPKKVFLNTVERNKLLSFLPNEKANELLVRLGHKNYGDPYLALTKIDFSKKREALEVLFNFFGIQDEIRAPQPLEENIELCTPQYGLFSHQREVARRVESALLDYPYKALLHMPTGAGKTRTAINIASKHLVESEPTLVCWLAQSAELLEQAAQEFKRSWGYIGNRELPIFRYWGSHNADLDNLKDGILIAGFAKMHALYQRDPNMLMKLGDRTTLTIVDEAHQAIAPTYKSIIEGLHTKRPKNKLLGLSATPGRSWDDIDADAVLADFFGTKKLTLQIPGFSNPVDYLTSSGYLAKPKFKKIESNLLQIATNNTMALNDYSEDVLELVGQDSDRNQLILSEAESLLRKHQRVILFAASVNHARLMTAILCAKGYDAELVTGETPPGTRERIIRKFKGSTTTSQIICNFGVLTTGFDAPKTSAAIIARPTRSLVLYSQMVGRAIRGPKQGGNSEADIVTVVDPALSGFGSIAEAFMNWEDVWD